MKPRIVTPPSVEDLAERADDRGDGYFFIVRKPPSSTKRRDAWRVGMRPQDPSESNHEGMGSTYGEAVQDLLDIQERHDSA